MRSLTRLAMHNGPAMNVLMILVIVVGAACTLAMRRESFPNFDLEIIRVSVPYPGATPAEAEEGVCQKIEESLRAIEGIKKVTSIAAEGVATVVVELDTAVRDPNRVLDEVRSEVERIPSFPDEIEEPLVRRETLRRAAIRVGVLGPVREGMDAERELREVAERIRSRLLQLPEVSQVDLVGARDYQIDIEIPEDKLRAHGLALTEAAEIVRRENRQLPAGTMRSPSQEILLRGDNRRTTGEEIAELPLIATPDGAVLTVGDLGEVRDDFADQTAISVFEGRPTIALSVERTSSEDLLSIVDAVRRYVEEDAAADLPNGYDVKTWADNSVEVRGRISTLLKNGRAGLILVFILLALFLDLRLAFWVAAGIPFALLATAAYLQFTGQTLNMLSMFGFVMALGIVVDDAIVVGENIYAHRQMDKPWPQAALEGTVEVIPSVTASVLTTVIAFVPLLFVSGTMGKFMAVMPVAIICMLVVSLFECITILPCHLGHKRNSLFAALNVFFYLFRWAPWLFGFLNRAATRGLDRFVDRVYRPTLEAALNNRMLFLSASLAVMILSAGLVKSGRTPFNFFPKLDGNQIAATISFPDGTPANVTDRWTQRMAEALERVNQRFAAGGGPVINNFHRVVGQQSREGGPGGQQGAVSGSHVGGVEVELVEVSRRAASSQEILAQWRAEVGPIPGADSVTYGTQSFGPGGNAIEFKLLAESRHVAQLDAAVESCKRRLATFNGVFDVADDSVPGKWELRLRVKDEAQALGVRNADLAETVRATYYGAEVMRVQRGRHEVKLMVRYPQSERRSLADFEEIRVRTRDGVELPLTEVAEIEVIRGYSEINRVDQLRSITVSADVNEKEGNAADIVESLKATFFPELLAEHSGVEIRWEGQQEQQRESFASLGNGLALALLGIFVLLVFEFKSYVQPILVMLIIPFGIIGAVLGHAITHQTLTLFSMFGCVALTGIVVNDSIVLIDFINSRIRAGAAPLQAILESGQRRFRPVMLTTVTTAAGLLPILLEKSLQAQVLIPMATSIAFGELFATAIVLYLLPVLYSVYASGLVWVAGFRRGYLRRQRRWLGPERLRNKVSS